MVARREILQTLCATVETGAAGRSIYAMTDAQIQLLREEGFRWEVTARCFEVSPGTLRRRRRECNMPVDENFDHISDEELDSLVSGVLHAIPQAGRNLVLGAYKSSWSSTAVGNNS